MPLTATQLQHLEQRLHEERARLLEQVRDFVSEESSQDSQLLAGDLSNSPTHPADLGTDVASEELEAAISTRRSAELADIDDALQRLATSPDTFGLDEDTGREIPFARLELIPHARRNVVR